MKLILLLAAVAMLCGCEKTMTNDEFIAECNKCHKAGYKCIQLVDMFSQETRGAVCRQVDSHVEGK